jgi:predicted house-cleaning noncanonical NTP pyrophosphatase (MazG superfamily)
MQKEYNKAIRDKIPEIMKKPGKSCTFKQLEDPDFLAALEKKLMEEIQEYYESHSVEELADLLEVIYRIAELRGVTHEHLDKIRTRKNEDRGGFSNNLFLISGET